MVKHDMRIGVAGIWMQAVSWEMESPSVKELCGGMCPSAIARRLRPMASMVISAPLKFLAARRPKRSCSARLVPWSELLELSGIDCGRGVPPLEPDRTIVDASECAL